MAEVVEGQGHTFTWTLTSADPTGTEVICNIGDKCIQYDGTWGTATFSLQGSNDGTTWYTLTDPQGNSITGTADRMEQIMETPKYLRPNLTTAGAGATIVAVIYVRPGRR
ncbi:MAG: hypothetical protein VW405_17110 [Rhodospirillaceae bacterium]